MRQDSFIGFTETAYRRLVRKAKRRFRFVRFREVKGDGTLVLWRHDVDFSPFRARRLAQIEAQEGIRSTYLVSLHNYFYNLLDLDVVRAFREIAEMGHELGLHFDPAFYSGRAGTRSAMVNFLDWERSILSKTFGVKITSLSFHNPGSSPPLADHDEIAGMVNAYGPYLRGRYTYVSDSNGIWRFRSLEDLLEADPQENLHVLTHPGWWVPKPMSPRARIQRCIDGRAASTALRYDRELAAARRPNIW